MQMTTVLKMRTVIKIDKVSAVVWIIQSHCLTVVTINRPLSKLSKNKTIPAQTPTPSFPSKHRGAPPLRTAPSQQTWSTSAFLVHYVVQRISNSSQEPQPHKTIHLATARAARLRVPLTIAPCPTISLTQQRLSSARKTKAPSYQRLHNSRTIASSCRINSRNTFSKVLFTLRSCRTHLMVVSRSEKWTKRIRVWNRLHQCWRQWKDATAITSQLQ